MSIRSRRVRRGLAAGGVVVLLMVGLCFPLSAQRSPQPGAEGKGRDLTANFDIRVAASLRAALLQRLGRPETTDTPAKLQQASRALAALKADLPAAAATLSPFTGGAELVRNPRGALTAPAPGTASAAIVTGFLETHAALYGLAPEDLATLQFRGESITRSNGLRMLRAEQAIDGIPVFQSDSRFILDRDGRLIRTTGRLVSRAGAAGADPASAIPASAAFVSAMQSVGIPVAANDVSIGQQSGKTQLRVANPQISDAVSSRLVYFPLAPGVLVLAYEQVTYTDGPGDYLTVVDAATGTLLWRKNIRNNQASTQQARFSVYVQADGRTPADSPAPQSPVTPTPGSGTQYPAIDRSIVEMLTAQDLVASPNGWIPDGTTTTTGNNVDACLDRISASLNVCDAGQLDDNGRPVGNPDTSGNNRDFLGSAPRNFSYTPSPVGSNPDAGDTPTGEGAVQDTFRRGAVTQLFYVTNWYHDRLFHLGFDEAAGNFQSVNFSGVGVGGDAVQAQAQDGSSTNNATFSTPPDGTPGRMQMYRFTGPTIDRDGALDTEIVIHELTHGLSNRLVGNATGLFWSVAEGMGEGWSDFYALSLLNGSQTDDPNGAYASGAYSTYRLVGLDYTDNHTYGIRRFPYSTDNTVNPLTWADVDDVTANYAGGIPISPVGFEQAGAFEVHNVGEIWALTLWEIRSRIIADPAGANGNVPAGNQTMLQLVTDALKLTPNDPSFIDAREALLDADCATNGCANERWIWEGFADRGLGYGAVAPIGVSGLSDWYHMSTGASPEMPMLDVSAITIDDTIGNNNGAIDPGEPVRLTVQLGNPWRGPSFGVSGATATLTSTTPGITIVDGSSTYPAIPAGGTAAGDTFLLRAGPGLACGQSIALTLQVTSALGTTSTSITRRVGSASGTAPAMTFTRTHSPGLAMPDDRPTGVSSTLSLADDLEIADLDFRVDNIQHTFVSDLTVLLRAPNGYGVDLIWAPGGLSSDGGDGDNLVNAVIDDEAVADLMVAPRTQAPYTGSWKPAFNSPSLGLTGGAMDPIGQLSRLNGLTTRGDWTVLAADNFSDDTGALNGWSLIVTPRAFTCAAFTDDTTPPTTTVSLTPPAPNGGGGWYVSPVTVAVSADDGPGGTVVETRCALDPAVPPTTFAQLPAGCPYGGAGSSVATQGQHTLYAASLDANGNAGAPVSASFGIDSTAPTATVSLSPPTPNGAAGWYTSPVTVAVSAADAVGTVAELRCVLDPAIVPAAFGDLPSGCPFAGAGGAVSGGGPHSVYAAAIDAAGHAGTPVSVTFRIDSAPPTTTVTLTPPTPNGAAGWYTSPVTLAVSAADVVGTVAEMRCVLDPTVPPPTFAQLPAGCSFGGQGASVGTPGPHTLYAASIDEAGNAGTPVSVTFRIDGAAPTTSVSLTPSIPDGSEGWYVSPVTVAVSGGDGPLGVLAETRCALDPGVPASTFAQLPSGCSFAGVGASVGTPGQHTVYAASVDEAGNASTLVSAAFRVDATPPVLTCPSTPPRFPLNQAGAVVTATVTDAASGPASPTVSGPADTTSAGSKTVSISGFDVAGNVGSIECPYTVGTVPTVTITAPTDDPTLAASTHFIPLVGTAADGVTAVTWTSDRGGSGTARGTTRWMAPVVPVQRGVNVITVTATDANGNVGTDTLTVTCDSVTQHLAEGSTGAFFSTEVALANPNLADARIALAFLRQDGSRVERELLLAPTSRRTLALGDIPELDATALSVTLSSLDLLPLGVERTMFWDATGYGGHGEAGVGQPRRTWLFAEGSQGFFHTYLLLLNPNPEATTATLTFLPEWEPAVVRTFELPPMSRLVVDASTVPELLDRSFGTAIAATRPILAERAMYFGNTPTRLFAGGHASTGAPDASTTWLFAEGATGAYFDTYVLLANPGTTPATVTLRYLLGNGTTITHERTVAPNARLTVDVENSDPQLASAAFATEVTSDVPIVAERSMYWVGEPGPWTEAHNTVGVTAPGTKWLLAEGREGGARGFQTYILLANPAASAADVTITYLKTDGTTVVRNHVVPPTSRHNVHVNGDAPELAEASFGALVEVTNGIGIVVERSMYWNSGGAVWAAGTNTAAMRIP